MELRCRLLSQDFVSQWGGKEPRSANALKGEEACRYLQTNTGISRITWRRTFSKLESSCLEEAQTSGNAINAVEWTEQWACLSTGRDARRPRASLFSCRMLETSAAADSSRVVKDSLGESGNSLHSPKFWCIRVMQSEALNPVKWITFLWHDLFKESCSPS